MQGDQFIQSDQQWKMLSPEFSPWNDVVFGVKRTELPTRWVITYRFHSCRDVCLTTIIVHYEQQHPQRDFELKAVHNGQPV